MSRQSVKGPKRLSKKLAHFCKKNSFEVKALINFMLFSVKYCLYLPKIFIIYYSS